MFCQEGESLQSKCKGLKAGIPFRYCRDRKEASVAGIWGGEGEVMVRYEHGCGQVYVK